MSTAGSYSADLRGRVLDGRSPEEVVRERLAQDRGLANPGYRPPSDPCVLPRAMLVIERAKEVSQPDNYQGGILESRILGVRDGLSACG